MIDRITVEDEFNKSQFRIKACFKWSQNKINAYIKSGKYFLVKKNKISLKAIDKFDKEFYENNNFGEAGDSKNSPYYSQHKFATKIEKMLAKELGISWDKYNKAVNSL